MKKEPKHLPFSDLIEHYIEGNKKKAEFRVWDKEKKEMLFFQNPVIDKEQGIIYPNINWRKNWIDTHILKMDRIGERYILMQWSYLKDKNNAKIYEFDLYKLPGQYKPIRKKPFIGIVILSVTNYEWVHWDVCRPRTKHMYGVEDLSRRGIVIGNILENPELLNLGKD